MPSQQTLDRLQEERDNELRARNPLHKVSTTKPSNPKDVMGVQKAPMSTVSAPVISELGMAMLEGALKYGRHNYRTVGVRASVYYDATMRHMMNWWEGEDIDPDSGLSHITKAIASLVVLRDSMIRGNWMDDRPPAVKAGWQNEHNAKVKELLAKYPDPKHPHRQIDITWADAAIKGTPAVFVEDNEPSYDAVMLHNQPAMLPIKR